jgi:hypothetical protein
VVYLSIRKFFLKSYGLEFFLEFILKGDSSFYIFSRNSEKLSTPYNSAFNTSTTVIKIQKEDKSQKSFISLGTFIDNNGMLAFKTFTKTQLINYTSNNTSSRSLQE